MSRKILGARELCDESETTLHKHKLNQSDVPDGPVDFNKKQAISLVIENRTEDPVSPIDGQIWLRTDL